MKTIPTISFFLLLFLFSVGLAQAASLKVVIEADTAGPINVNDQFNLKVSLQPTSGENTLVGAKLAFNPSNNFNFEERGTLIERKGSGVIFNPLTSNGLVSGKWNIAGVSTSPVTLSSTGSILGLIPVKAIIAGTVSSVNLIVTSPASYLTQYLDSSGNRVEYTLEVEVKPFTIVSSGNEPACTDGDWKAVLGICNVQCGNGIQTVTYQQINSCTGTKDSITQSCTRTCSAGQSCNAQNQCVESTAVCTSRSATACVAGVACPGNTVIPASGCPAGQSCNAQNQCVESTAACAARAATACVAGVACPGNTNIPASGCPTGQSCNVNNVCAASSGGTTSAVTVTTTGSKIAYTSGEIIPLKVNGCSGTSILTVSSPTKIVDIKQGSGSWSYNYNSASSLETGSYTIKAGCDNPSASGNLIVSVSSITTANVCTSNPCNHGTCNPTSISPFFTCTCAEGYTGAVCNIAPSSGGGGGRRCDSDWSCGLWTVCSANLNQTRICTDKNQCEKPKVEVQACGPCPESWVCSEWSSCTNGAQTRTCIDEHSCGTGGSKPQEQQSCSVTSGNVPQQQPYYPQQYVPSTIQQPGVVKQSALTTMVNAYKYYFIGGGAVLLLAIIIIFVVMIIRHHRPAENVDELVSWIKEEEQRGSSQEQIRESLKSTKWKESEVSKAFGEAK